MLLAGDEFGNSQQGNNNAYCQDNAVSWLDWRQADSPEGRRLTHFIARLAAYRRDHASLRSMRYANAHQEVAPGMTGVSWFDVDGHPMSMQAWGDPEGRALGLRRAIATPQGLDVTLTLMNGGEGDVSFTLPDGTMAWRMLLDSTRPDAPEGGTHGKHYTLHAHGIALFSGHPRSTEHP
jgi:glycogen operon protein